MRFDPTHFEPLSATPAGVMAKAPLTPLPTLPSKPRLPWKEDPFHQAVAVQAATRTADVASQATSAATHAPTAQSARLAGATVLDASAAPKNADAEVTAELPQSAKLGRAELRTLLAIDLEGGQICVRSEGSRLRYERLDEFGDVQERYAGATVRSLIANGHLRFRRCAFGGNVYVVDGEPLGRAGYRRRPKRS